MKSLVSWFASNSVAANLLMLLLLIGGGATALSVRMEVFPEFSLDAVTVRVPYPGAVPAEIEESICVKLEEQVHAIEGVKRVRSSAREGVGSVTIEVRKGYDARELMDDIKTRVDAIATFPEEAERPIYQELTYRKQVIEVAIHGAASERSLKHVAEQVRDELSALDSISQVELASARPYEISIEVSEEALRRHALSFDDIAQAVRRSSLDLSGGAIKTDGGEILLRTMGQAYVGAEFERIPLLTSDTNKRFCSELRVGMAELNEALRVGKD